MSEEIEEKVYQKLIEVIDSLPVQEQICMFMFFYLDIRVAEIADIMKISENEANRAIEVAKKRIRVYVGEVEDEQIRKYCIAKLPFLMDVYAQEMKKL